LSSEDLVQALREARLVSMLRPLEGVFHPDTEMPRVPDIDYCPYPADMKCDLPLHAEWVRSVDGSCNNLRQQIIGRSMTPFRRLLPAKYSDGE
jgi:hypothetical protein